MTAPQILHLILNCPCEGPKAHWHYQMENETFSEKQDGEQQDIWEPCPITKGVAKPLKNMTFEYA